MEKYSNKPKSLNYGDDTNSTLEKHQEISGPNFKESPDEVKIQYNIQSLECKDKLIGDHETHLVETHEANLHTNIMDCAKNPCHKEFIPIETFSLKHLPEGLQDIDLYEFIKATADLTVRVSVQMISPDRPDVWPETKITYPFYNIRKSTNLRTGSGRIQEVLNFTGGVNKDGSKHWKKVRNCWCKHCEGSDSPSNVWWEFDVSTATHLVFDDIEASHTSLRLFYDSDDCPVVSVDKISVDLVNIECDWCRLKCVTCEKQLGNKLKEMWEHYLDVWWKVLNKYETSRDVFKLTFIVSHPHGCSKQVSVGQWKDKHQVGDQLNKFTYTTCTCPGSSGAYVQCVGFATGWWLNNALIHSGSLKSGLNYSGAGWVI